MKFSWVSIRIAIGVLIVGAGSLGLIAGRFGLTLVHAASNQVLTGTPGERHIVLDQFGYFPDSSKVAVIRAPVDGFDRDQKFTPGARFGVRRIGSQDIILEKEIESWNNNNVQSSSGDRGWWFDFTELKAPGKYEVVDLQHGVKSAPFEIGSSVYKSLLKTAVRTYFYQRSGYPKKRPYADICWEDDAAYLGAKQDTEARDITDPDNPSKIKDMRGGWYDAGDTNKYVTFASSAVHQLLAAYEGAPAIFTDDFGIPESGNGIPDLIDEVHWEIKWFKRMQLAEGGFALKVGATKYAAGGAPSQDSNARFYVPECTSATISGAGVLAHAALVFQQFPALVDEARELEGDAKRAWDRFQAQPSMQEHCDSGKVLSGNADLSAIDQKGKAVIAAVYLWALTHEDGYLSYLSAHYRDARPYRDIGWSRYNEDEGHALLWFTSLPSAPAGLKSRILGDFSREVQNASNGVFGFEPSRDLYRAYLHDPQFHWGSNQPRANYGNANLDAMRYAGASAAQKRAYYERAMGILHYFHGVNPFGMVMLSNMDAVGSTRSVNQIFHTWFWPGTAWSDAKASKCGPAPGFVVGGPNRNVANDGVPRTLVPPVGQPPQKSFAVSNDPKDAPWSFTEPGIYYQSAYIKLLSGLMMGGATEP